MSDFFKDLDEDVEHQIEERERRTLCTTIQEIHAEVPTSGVSDAIVAVELCVLSYAVFEKGWRYVLTEQCVAGRVEETKAKMTKISPIDREKRLFHLTVWYPAKRSRNENVIKPGALLFCDEVTSLKIFREIYRQGSAPYASVMKHEQDTDGPSKKTKTTHTTK